MIWKKKTIDLLNKAVELGFDREKALADIDASLDNRKPLAEEEIDDKLSLNKCGQCSLASQEKERSEKILLN